MGILYQVSRTNKLHARSLISPTAPFYSTIFLSLRKSVSFNDHRRRYLSRSRSIQHSDHRRSLPLPRGRLEGPDTNAPRDCSRRPRRRLARQRVVFRRLYMHSHPAPGRYSNWLTFSHSLTSFSQWGGIDRAWSDRLVVVMFTVVSFSHHPSSSLTSCYLRILIGRVPLHRLLGMGAVGWRERHPPPSLPATSERRWRVHIRGTSTSGFISRVLFADAFLLRFS